MMSRSFPLTLLVLMATAASAQPAAPLWQTPVVDGVGPSVHFPEAAVPPDTALHYRVLVDVTKAAEDGEPPTGLSQVARLFNSFALYGTDPAEMEVVAVLHGPATAAALSDEAHRAHLGDGNPSLSLIRRLHELGVEVFVCGNALAGQGYAPDEVADEVTLATSALAVLTTYQLRGYAVLSY